ncbi:MAG: pro-sigmaK processing inhibitor BofA family protein [Clostridia bacterium]|nr:pro-sigmaK processing inhibitor BofA family protein [Clostridia bacterium]
MSQVISAQLFSWAIYAVSLFVICLFTINMSERFSRLCMQGVMGSSFILILNCILFKFNLCVGINAVTVGISALLGMPGIGLMYLLLYIF